MHSTNNDTKKENIEYFRLYELLLNTLQQYHDRWIDNYKIFLSFHAFLLPAVSAFLAYVINGQHKELSLIVVFLCLVGIIASWQSIGLIRRIRLDSDLRLKQLVRLEEKMPNLPLKPFTEGKEMFFIKTVEEVNKDERFPNILYKNKWIRGKDGKGIRGIDAYVKISIAIMIVYALISAFAIIVALYALGMKILCAF